MMKRLKNLLLALSILSLLAVSFGCRAINKGKSPQTETLRVDAELGQETEIKTGQDLIIGAEGLRINFVAVKGDSRCPENVKCFWEGDAEVILDVSKTGNEAKLIKLHANRKFVQSDEYGSYEVRLIFLSRDNSARLVVKKK
jgi:hypothetical protein